jgi:hypothetical protein
VPGAETNEDDRLLAVGPDFFSTMQIPISAGREILESDRPGSPAVAVINERFAKVNFGGRNPVGQHLTLWEEKKATRDMEVIGASKDARYGGLKGEIPPLAYIAYDQGYPEPDRMVYQLRGARPAGIREFDAGNRSPGRLARAGGQCENSGGGHRADHQPGDRVCPIVHRLRRPRPSDCLRGHLWHVAYNVARRIGETGIRMALGSQRGVVWMILRQVFVLRR